MRRCAWVAIALTLTSCRGFELPQRPTPFGQSNPFSKPTQAPPATGTAATPDNPRFEGQVTQRVVDHLASMLANFYAQGDDPLAHVVIQGFMTQTGCRAGHSPAYWQTGEEAQERQARREAIAQTKADLIGFARRDPQVALRSAEGEPVAFVGVLVAVDCEPFEMAV